MLSRGSALTTDRIILVPDDGGTGHYFQIISTDDELKFQRFLASGKPQIDSRNRFVGGRGDEANVETFMSLSNPYNQASTPAASAPPVINIAKPLIALDDLTINGILYAPGGISLGGNAHIDSNGCIRGSPSVRIDGDIRADSLYILQGNLLLGNISLRENKSLRALQIASNVWIQGSKVSFGSDASTSFLAGDVSQNLSLVVGNKVRASFASASSGPSNPSARLACGNVALGKGGGEVFFGSTVSGNTELSFYKANTVLVSMEASTRGLAINVHGVGASTTSFYSSFTGTHNCIAEESTYNAIPGMIVEATGDHRNIGNIVISVTDAVPVVRIAPEGSKAVFGVIGEVEPAGVGGTRTMVSGTLSITSSRKDRRITVCSLGEGAMWVISEGGPIETGDFIEVSSIPGVGRKSSSGVMLNTIVAKSTGPCNFDNDTVVVMTELRDGNGAIVLDSSSVPVMIPLLDGSGQVVTRPKYQTLQLMSWVGYYIGVTFHCG
jgi:hypothetical protein